MQKNKLTHTEWVPLSQSIVFLLRHKTLLGLSSVFVFLTALLTYIGFDLSVDYLSTLTGNFFINAPDKSTITGLMLYYGWVITKFLYSFIIHIVSFYLAFLLAFTLTTPFYVVLSGATERKIYPPSNNQQASSPLHFLTDIYEGAKIGLFGVLVAVIAISISFVPILGHLLVFLIYAFYSALMFIDYPTSRKRWTFSQKLSWVFEHKEAALRIGLLPALVSMIPILNIFLIALLFPVLTVHTTINFLRIEQAKTSL